MKTLMAIAIVVVIMSALISSAFAATVSTDAIPITAQVTGSLTLSVSLFKDSASGPTGSGLGAINFGQLQVFTNTVTGGQTLRSSDTGPGAVMGGVVALVSANSHGDHYTISQTGTALTSGTNTIPAGACRMVPVYSPNDLLGGIAQGAIPAGATTGQPASWVTTTASNMIYNSESSSATVRIVQAHFAVTDDPSAGATDAVLINQPGGTYSATVTFTVVSP